MSEANLTRSILKYLNSLDNCKAIKLHGGRFQEKGTPDVLCCYDGRCWFFEVKVKGKHPTDIQRLRLAEWKATGAHASVVNDVTGVKHRLGLTSPKPYLIHRKG